MDPQHPDDTQNNDASVPPAAQQPQEQPQPPEPPPADQEQLQREIDEALAGADLDALMAEVVEDRSKKEPRAQRKGPLRPGQTVIGTVAGVVGEDIFIELADHTQGVVAAEEFGAEQPAVGGRIELQVAGYNREDDLVILSCRGAATQAAWDTLTAGQTVEGRVSGHNKGGLVLDINGIRAFMPISHVELFRVEDPSVYEGQKMRCQVVEADPGSRNLVVSRRALLEVEAEAQREKIIQGIEVGQIVAGTVKNIQPYGAFVDIGGLDGLLHVSDMSHTRVTDPASVLKPGQKIEVKILKFDPETRKLSLGLKQVQADPWQDVAEKYHIDDVVTGRVVRMMDFGAFVEIEPGVDALVPISEMSFEKRITHPQEVLAVGDVVQAKVLKVEPQRKRLSLSLKRMQGDPWMGASARWPEGSTVSGVVARTSDFGAFVEIAPGVAGLVHISELSDQHVRTVNDVVQVGQTVEAKVLSVDESARRISLSLKQANQADVPDVSHYETTTQERPPEKPRKRPLRGGLD